ncbi:hypothetical protein DPMN_114410 [Dreissena polymorpha]|uniref:Uncharacterized protein n=1 Tax=Dreissena polymorpha TaxID=45954 RepID=A0A9D4KJC6_DREPO|nr:hypothetical protein DPMN_114410 [Dreissena polymorpha]
MVAFKGQGLSAKGVLKNKKDINPALSPRRRLYGLSGRHMPSTRTPERFPSTLSVLGTAVLGHFYYPYRSTPLEILACIVCISAQGPPRPSSTLSTPLLPSLFRRCSETTIHLRTIAISLGDSSKFWESAK